MVTATESMTEPYFVVQILIKHCMILSQWCQFMIVLLNKHNVMGNIPSFFFSLFYHLVNFCWFSVDLILFFNNKYGISLQANCKHTLMTRTVDWLYFVLFIGRRALTHSHFIDFACFQSHYFVKTIYFSSGSMTFFPHLFFFFFPTCYYSNKI